MGKCPDCEPRKPFPKCDDCGEEIIPPYQRNASDAPLGPVIAAIVASAGVGIAAYWYFLSAGAPR